MKFTIKKGWLYGIANKIPFKIPLTSAKSCAVIRLSHRSKSIRLPSQKWHEPQWQSG